MHQTNRTHRTHRTHRKPARWREVEGALEVTALAAVECALVIGLLTALGIPHGGL